MHLPLSRHGSGVPHSPRMPLKVGIQVNTTQRVFRWSEIRELATVAEELGLDSLWTEDHLFYEMNDVVIGPWEAWTILAGLADATERVRIGSMVTPLALRSPTMLAKLAETVDEMSSGRLVLGVGVGWGEEEHRAVGATLERKLTRFLESWNVILTAFDDGQVDHKGETVTVEGFRLVPRGPRRRPEMMVGSIGPQTLRATLPHVDGWNWDGFSNRPERFAESSEKVNEICIEIGRDPDTVYRSAHLIVRFHDAQGLPLDPIPADVPLITGPPPRVAEAWAGFVEAGADEVQLIVDPATPSALERLAEAKQILG